MEDKIIIKTWTSIFIRNDILYGNPLPNGPIQFHGISYKGT